MKNPRWKLTLIALGLASCGLQAMPQISLTTADTQTATTKDTLVLLVAENSLQQHPLLKDVTVQKIVQQEKFTGKNGKKLEILAPMLGYSRLLLLGTGDTAKLKQADITELGADIGAYLTKSNAEKVRVDTTVLKDSSAGAWLAQGVELRSYRFDKYKTKAKEPSPT